MIPALAVRRLIVVVLVAAAGPACHRRAARPPAAVAAALAHLTAQSGTVTVEIGKAAAIAAALGQPLGLGDVITTGKDGSATITFAAGNAVVLQPNTQVVIRPTGGNSAEIGPVLLSGALRAEGSGQARLTIGTPFGALALGPTLTVMQVSTLTGAVVDVGAVDFTTGDSRQAVTAGRAVILGGVGAPTISAAPGAKEEAAPAAPAPAGALPITLFARASQAQVGRGAGAPMQPAPARTAIRSGDRLRLRAGPVARLQLGADAAAALRPGTGLAVGAATQGSDGVVGRYVLDEGSVRLTFPRRAGLAQSHTVAAGGADVAITPGEREADVEIVGNRRRAVVLVRLGRVTVAGRPIPPGSAVDVRAGSAGKVRPLVANHVDLHSGARAIVYADRAPPALNFVWAPEGTAQSTLLEVATDANFDHVVLAERVERGNLIVDKLPPAPYFWRTDGDAGTVSRVEFRAEPRSDCAQCRRDNVVEDTGEKTVVVFQQALPSIALRWRAVEGASTYRVKVFADGRFDRPLTQAEGTDLQHAFDAGAFPAGKYYWTVSALDQNAHEVAAGRMNSLQIAYDNAVTGLLVRTPKARAVVSGRQIAATGVLERGASLSVNGRPVDADSEGHFEVAVPLRPGHNLLTFVAIGRDEVERIYLRPVRRR